MEGARCRLPLLLWLLCLSSLATFLTLHQAPWATPPTHSNSRLLKSLYGGFDQVDDGDGEEDLMDLEEEDDDLEDDDDEEEELTGNRRKARRKERKRKQLTPEKRKQLTGNRRKARRKESK